MKLKLHLCGTSIVVLGFVLGGGLQAAPIVSRIEVNGVPQVLRIPTGGYAGAAYNTGRPAFHFGHNRICLTDHANYGYTYFWVDPALSGDISGSHDSKTGLAKYWNTAGTQYAGTVSGNTKFGLANESYGMAYLPDAQTIVWRNSSNGGYINEVQAARSVDGVDVVTEGTASDQTLSARLRSRAAYPTTGTHTAVLCLSGMDDDYYYLLSMDPKDSSAPTFMRCRLARAYSLDPGATTYGTRVASDLIRSHVPSATVKELVPGYNDVFRDLASDAYNMVWALSNLNNTNFLTAFTLALDGTFTQIDLDPDDDNGVGSKYINLAGLIVNTAGDPVNAHGLCVNASGSRIYILADGGGTTNPDNFFIFRRLLAEIRNDAAANIAEETADLVGVLEEGSGTVTCYWGEADGGTDPDAWDKSDSLGVRTAPACLTNSVSNLKKGTRYYYRFHTANMAGTFWATNSATFVTEGVEPTVAVDNDAGAANLTESSALLRGQVLSGLPEPHVWIYWGTAPGSIGDKESWNLPPLDLGVAGVGAFSREVTGLAANRDFWYCCYGSNVNNDAWAPAVTNFTTALPLLIPSAASVLEGAAGTTTPMVFAVTLSTASGREVRVDYETQDGTATEADNDYAAASGTLVIPAGVTSTQIVVTVIGDNNTEATETLTLNLSNVAGATLTAAQVTGTIVFDDFEYYVRGDGQGNDANNGLGWSSAWATLQKALDTVPSATEPANNIPASIPRIVYVQSSEGGQRYHAAERAGYYTPSLDIEFRGGWQDVDTTPAQSGQSVVEDLVGAVDIAGLRLNIGNHDRWFRLSVNNFLFTNVTCGVDVSVESGVERSRIFLQVSNCVVRSQADGLYVRYTRPSSDIARIRAHNVDVVAGLGGAGSAIYCNGYWIGSEVSAAGNDPLTGAPLFSRLSAPNGTGIVFSAINVNYSEKPAALIERTIIHDCFGPAVDMRATQVMQYGLPASISNVVRVTMQHCTVANNGGDGLLMIGNQAGSWANVTNSIFAANGGEGIKLVSSGFTCNEGFNVFADGNGLWVNDAPQSPAATSAAGDPAFMATGDKPSPWYALAGAASPAWKSASDGTHSGAIQDDLMPRGTLLLIR